MRTRKNGQTFMLFVFIVAATLRCSVPSESPEAPANYSSFISSLGNYKVLHLVEYGECVHAAAINVSEGATGGILWNKSPLGLQSELDLGGRLVWSTIKSVIYTHRLHPKIAALSVNDGDIRWAWPASKWWPWRLLHPHGIELPWGATLKRATPTDLGVLLVLSQNPDTHVFALHSHKGIMLWNFASSDGYTVSSMESVDDVVYVAISCSDPVLCSPSAASVQQPLRLGVVKHSSFSHPEPVLADDSIRSNSGASVICLNVSDGALLWVHAANLPEKITSVLLTRDMLIVSGETEQSGDDQGSIPLIGLDPHMGEMVWQRMCPTELVHNRTCNIQAIDSKMAVITAETFSLSKMQAFDLQTGEDLWNGLQIDPEMTNPAPPIPVGKCSALTAPAYSLYILCECAEESDAAMNQLPDFDPREVAASVGTSIRWHGRKETQVEAGDSGGALIHKDGVQMLSGKANRLCAYSVDTKKGSLSWASKLAFDAPDTPDPTLPAKAGSFRMSPLVTASALIVPTSEGIFALDLKKGQKTWEWQLPQHLTLHGWQPIQNHGTTIVLRASGSAVDGRIVDGTDKALIMDDDDDGGGGGGGGDATNQHVFALQAYTGEVLWSFVTPNSSAGPQSHQQLAMETSEQLLLLDGCYNGSCCLWGVDYETGDLEFGHCFDARANCNTAKYQRRNNQIIDVLLGAQVAVMLLSIMWSSLYYIFVARRGPPPQTYEPMAQIENSTEADHSDC